jgi:OsmC subfamily peroxiredoxin
MPIRKAEAEWKGNLVQGTGRLKVGSGAFEGPYSFKSRLEEGQSATNPEELIGAAHAGCFTMALTAQLSQAGITPNRIHTVANVRLDRVGEAFAITASATLGWSKKSPEGAMNTPSRTTRVTRSSEPRCSLAAARTFNAAM